MALQAWSKIEFYDIGNSCMAYRYSGFSGQGEYWVTRPAVSPGKSRRQQVSDVLTMIEEAIERGQPPGEVK